MTETIRRVTETDVGTAVMIFLAGERDGEASLERLKSGLPVYLALCPEDQAPSAVRDGEQAWEQQLRNLVNHRLKPGNPIKEGLLSFADGHLSLTAAGREAAPAPAPLASHEGEAFASAAG